MIAIANAESEELDEQRAGAHEEAVRADLRAGLGIQPRQRRWVKR